METIMAIINKHNKPNNRTSLKNNNITTAKNEI